MTWVAEKDAAVIWPAVKGATVAINCSTTVQVVDFTSIPQTGIKVNDPASQNPVGHFVRVTADGGAVYYVTGSNFAQLNAISNPNAFTTVNTTTGKVTINGSEVDVIPSGSFVDFVVPQSGTAQTQNPPGSNSACRYIALLSASGNPVARMHQSGP